MAMTDDPNYINDPDRQLASNIDKLGDRYSGSHKRSRTENSERSQIRARAKELGIRTDAFQVGVRIVKDLTANERKDFLRDLDLIVKTLGARQADLFPDEALRAAKREASKGNKPRTPAELDANTDTNPASDPANGGAQVDLEEAIAAQQARELAEGDALLAGKSDSWRAGFNAVAAGGERGSNPYMEGSAESRDWFSGYEAATSRVFEASAPAPATDQATYNDGTGKPEAKPKKPSQSERAAQKRAAAGMN